MRVEGIVVTTRRTGGGRYSPSPSRAAGYWTDASPRRALDDEITTVLTADQRKALEEALQVLANRAGLP